MSAPTVAVFAMYEHGHFQRALVLAADLARAGFEPHVFTDRRFRCQVEAAGCVFADLFADHELEDADGESVPLPCRNVSFAGAYGEEIAARVERLDPSLVVYDTFAVVGRVVALLIGLPYVNVCSNHCMDPVAALASLAVDPRVAVAPACLYAVENLHRLGIADASPFSYVAGMSPFLNVYCEPRAYLREEEVAIFEPVAFYGSLPNAASVSAATPSPFGPEPGLRVYASLGTVVWRYWAAEALSALRAVADVLAETPGTRGLIGLGGREVDHSLERSNVRVASYTDQQRVLRDTDVFVTHHGLNSTHEAIFNGVPMISYPFFGDQPQLAERCRELGLAVPLVAEPRGPVTHEAVATALARVQADHGQIAGRLVEARQWELDVIAARGSVVERIAALVGGQREDAAA